MAIDEHGATSTHDFQVHVFHDPSSRQLVNTGWPLMLTLSALYLLGAWLKFKLSFFSKTFSIFFIF